MKNIERIYSFIDKAQTYYLATVDKDQPKVRPFGTILLFEGKLYIQTGKVKDVSKQIAENPKVELCAFNDGKWIRVTGELVNDDSREVKTRLLDKMPYLRGMYNEDDGNMQMLYFRKGTATIFSFTDKPKTMKF